MADYDGLPPREQAQVRAAWSEDISRLAAALDLAAEAVAAGLPYVESDDRGRAALRMPGDPGWDRSAR